MDEARKISYPVSRAEVKARAEQLGVTEDELTGRPAAGTHRHQPDSGADRIYTGGD